MDAVECFHDWGGIAAWLGLKWDTLDTRARLPPPAGSCYLVSHPAPAPHEAWHASKHAQLMWAGNTGRPENSLCKSLWWPRCRGDLEWCIIPACHKLTGPRDAAAALGQYALSV